MIRALGILCAALVVVATGCALNLGNTRVEAVVKIDEQALDTSLENASLKIKEELQRRGLQVTVNPEAEAVRIISTTRSGDRFTVLLTRSQTASGKEQTKVRVEWDKAPDRELWLGLLAAATSVALQSPR